MVLFVYHQLRTGLKTDNSEHQYNVSSYIEILKGITLESSEHIQIEKVDMSSWPD